MEFTSDWFTFHQAVWRKVLLPRLPAGPRRWLELGAYEGRSAVWAKEHIATPGEVVCVDVWLRADVEERFDRNTAGAVTKVKSSFRPYLLDAAGRGEKFSGVYIDGDHCGRATLEAAVLSWMLLSDGGILVFDDYRYQNPSGLSIGRIDTHRGIDAFLDCYCLQLRVLHRAAQVIVMKTS